MNQNEERGGIFEIHSHMPSAQLRDSLEGVEQCMDLFQRTQIDDFLKAINTVYLSGEGEIEEAKPQITADIDAETERGHTEMFHSDVSSWGGVGAGLKWQQSETRQCSLWVSLRYSIEYNFFHLILEGSEGESELQEAKPTEVEYIGRGFRLNPSDTGLNRAIEHLLFAFAGELLDADIVKKHG